ncbi:hypothetical protein [Caenispirillum bisanense]|uniref:hypothetical protein n=1 Tax=Caenispirillum bisanense TaxID=414052 RepID=UPI0031D719B6
MLGVVIAVNARRRLMLVEVDSGYCSLLTDCEEAARPGVVLEGLLDRPGIETVRNINTGGIFSARVEVANLPRRAALLHLVASGRPS